jgi:hypothetical protein
MEFQLTPLIAIKRRPALAYIAFTNSSERIASIMLMDTASIKAAEMMEARVPYFQGGLGARKSRAQLFPLPSTEPIVTPGASCPLIARKSVRLGRRSCRR